VIYGPHGIIAEQSYPKVSANGLRLPQSRIESRPSILQQMTGNQCSRSMARRLVLEVSRPRITDGPLVAPDSGSVHSRIFQKLQRRAMRLLDPSGHPPGIGGEFKLN
jgi:hypothetical protein